MTALTFSLWEMGYRGLLPDDVIEWVQAHPETVVVDIRFAIMKPPRPWAQETLRAALKDQYLHFKSLGNRLYKQPGEIQLDDPKKGIAALIRIMESGREPILLCACESFDACHRAEVVRRLEKTIKLERRAVFDKRQKRPDLFT